MRTIKKKRILVISPFFYPQVGGSQNYMEDIYAFLIRKHPELKVDVLCYNTDKAEAKSIYRGLTIYRIPALNILKGQFALPNPISLFKFLWENRNIYDLLHCSTRFFDSSWWAPLYAKLSGEKIILTDHCATHPVHRNLLIKWVAKLIDLTLINLSLRFYDAIFVTNKATQKFFKETFNLPARIIYGGVDTSIFKPIQRKAGKRLCVAFIGRMIETKGASLLFDVAKSMNNVDFIFAGPGELTDIFTKIIKGNKIRHIKIVGPLSRIGVSKLFLRLDILVHPSFHHEGFPNILLEAGITKMAVISTDMGGSKEIIIDKKTGLLVRPRDRDALKEALQTLIHSKVLRDRLARNLYAHVLKNFTRERVSEQLYRELSALI